jgi:hypothetical protein
MTAADRFIASCHSWNDFWDRARALSSEIEKGMGTTHRGMDFAKAGA